MSIVLPTPEEAAEIPPLVRASAYEVVTAVADETEATLRYSVGYVAAALAITEGPRNAHQFASDTIDSLGMRPADAFGVWSDLYKEGDKRALPKARQAIGLASEQTTFLERLGAVHLAGLHTVERLVELVEAGETKAMELAREMAGNVPPMERAALFGRLYAAGDITSLNLAIKAAKAAKEYAEQTDDRTYYRSERALSEMAQFALKKEKITDVLKLMDHLEDGKTKAELHAELYQQGRTESLQEVLDYIRIAPNNYYVEPLERKLALAGYTPALKSVKRRVMPPRRLLFRPKPHDGSAYSKMEDLTLLHQMGIAGASQRVAEIVKTHERPEHYMNFLGRVGLVEQEIELAQTLYNQDPSVFRAEHLYRLRPDNQLWKTIFNQRLYDHNDAWRAAAQVKMLANRLKP